MVLRAYSSLCLQESLQAGSGDPLGYWASSLGQSHARQAPYPLLYYSSPIIFSLPLFLLCRHPAGQEVNVLPGTEIR